MEWLQFFLVAAIWSGSFAAIHYVVGVIPPFFGGTLRVGLAVVFLLVLCVLRGGPLTVRGQKQSSLWLMGLFMQGIPFALLFWGEQRISAGLAGILNSTVPLWTALLGHVFLRDHEALTSKRIAGLLMGLLGVGIIFFPKIALPGNAGAAAGTLAVALMAVSYAAGTLLNRRLFVQGTNVSVMASLLQQQLAAFAFLLPLSLLFEGKPDLTPLQSPALLTALLYLGWLSTAVAFALFLSLIRRWGAARASAVTYIVPPGSILVDFFLTHRLPVGSELAGAAAILLGVFLIND